MSDLGVLTEDRYLGSLVGLAVGDALGAPFEFTKRDSLPPLTGMAGGGHFGLKAGTYTDDTAMALCLAESLLESNGHDGDDQMRRYVRWYLEGHLSADGRCLGMGKNTWRALRRFIDTGAHSMPFGHAQTDGNGSLMRLAPVALYYANDSDKAVKYAVHSSRTTHSSKLAEDSCALMAWLLVAALHGLSKDDLLEGNHETATNLHDEVKSLAQGDYKVKTRDDISSSGFVLDTLEAALWAFHNTDTFRDGALLAVNLGDDADTVGAVYGQLAGAYYGYEAIPLDWVSILRRKDDIKSIARRLYIARA